jgi:uncharacterized surface protein with fasciclin (FAS1) repeats
MVSLGPNSCSKDYTFMYHFSNDSCPSHTDFTMERSIKEYLQQPMYSLFYLLICNAGLVHRLNDCTLFIVTNENMIKNGMTEQVISSFDRNQCRQIVLYSMIPYILVKQNLTSIPSIFYISCNSQKLFITNTLSTFINYEYEIEIFDINCSNGVLHSISNVLIPYNI